MYESDCCHINNCDCTFAALDDGSLGYSMVIAHAQREPDNPIFVLVLRAERLLPWKQISELHLTPTHNVFVRKPWQQDGNKTVTDDTFRARYCIPANISERIIANLV